MGFLSFLRVTEPHCSARPGWRKTRNASDKMRAKTRESRRTVNDPCGRKFRISSDFQQERVEI